MENICLFETEKKTLKHSQLNLFDILVNLN